MAEIIALICSSCGGKLKISSDINRFTCIHCGQEQIVLHSGNDFILQPLQETLSNLQQVTARNASEQAIRRIQAEICQIEEQENEQHVKIEEFNKIILAHKKRDQEHQFIWINPLIIIIVFIGYLVMMEIGKNNELLNALQNNIIAPFICWSVIILVIYSWIATIIEAIFSSGPKPSRKEVEQLIQEAEMELDKLRTEKQKKYVEISRHQEIVRQGM
jgi:hypothetical protein